MKKELESSSFSIASKRRRTRWASCCCVTTIVVSTLVVVLLAALLAIVLVSKPVYNKNKQDTRSVETMQQLQSFRATVPNLIKKRQQNQTMTKDELLGWARYAAGMTSAAYTATFDAHACANPVGANLTRTFAGRDVRAMLARDDVAQQTVLAFKGPSDVVELGRMLTGKLVDVQGQGQVRSNYQASFESIRKPILEALQAQASKMPYPVLVTGHSSGAAVAVLMALALKANTSFDVSAVTLGEPKVGNQAFADHVDSVFPPASMRMIRGVHTLDDVPNASIFGGKGFAHHQGELWQYQDPAAANNLILCAGQADSNCSVSIGARNAHVVPPSLAMNAEHWHYFDIELGSRKSKQCGMSGGQPLYVLMMTSRARNSFSPSPNEQARNRTTFV